MNWNRKPVKQPKDPNRPNKIKVTGLAEFKTVVARADQLEKRNGVWELKERGDYKILSITTFGPGTGNGGRHGTYEMEVSWHDLRTEAQPNLI